MSTPTPFSTKIHHFTQLFSKIYNFIRQISYVYDRISCKKYSQKRLFMTNWLIHTFIPNSEQIENHNVRMSYGKFSGWIGIICNFLLFIIKFIAGTISGSVSITADAVNNLSDASSSIISLLGFKLSARPADAEHPFGHGRYEYLSGLMVTIFILVIGIELLKSSFHKILHPSAIEFNIFIAVTLILSIFIKIWLSYFNKKIGTLIHSQTLIATATDSKNDVISTLAVLIAATISHISPLNLDGFMGLAVAIFIIYSGYGLIKDTLDPLLGKAPDPTLADSIKNTILSYPGVLGTHDLILHDYGPGRQFASVHVEMAAEENVLTCHELIDNIEQDFLNNFNLHMIIHYDPVITDDPLVQDLRHWISNEIKKLDSRLSIHDLRIVPGTTCTNVIFDCVVPPSLQISASEITKTITKLVADKYPGYVCIITIDASFAAIPK